MVRLAIRVLITAFVFTYVVPMIGGAHFSGSFWPEGVIYGLLFAATAFVVGRALGYVTAALAIGTLGFGCLFVIPLYLFCFWLLPAAELMVLAHFFPQHLAFNGWGSAILAGLVLLFVNVVTTAERTKRASGGLTVRDNPRYRR